MTLFFMTWLGTFWIAIVYLYFSDLLVINLSVHCIVMFFKHSNPLLVKTVINPNDMAVKKIEICTHCYSYQFRTSQV